MTLRIEILTAKLYESVRLRTSYDALEHIRDLRRPQEVNCPLQLLELCHIEELVS